ncbi:glycosyltransferase family 32 protein [Dysgonomonas sp. ZJ709]|uniref:glycosyltransferase family 32 protein n=1 Tax=Dysgonomonas sp. ZJ709 TaxID=2709797 RepID=UPI002103284D|nr:glycosyltransferase [Dysgonomonas sp. ZJ709]
MTLVPKIIHQIWSDTENPMPKLCETLSDTWKQDYPGWKYEFWNNARMNNFILQYYPQYWDIYQRFAYNVQRWDVVRYLILYKMGGMYVDFDYESVKPLDKIIAGKSCCFALEPESHKTEKLDYIFNNVLMLSTPGHPFMAKIISSVLSPNITTIKTDDKKTDVLSTTGPWALVKLYEALEKRHLSYSCKVCISL